MNNDITLNPIVIVSLTKEQIGLIIKSLSFTRSNFKLNPSFHYQSIAIEERLKEELKKYG
jgi:hypothetical protein